MATDRHHVIPLSLNGVDSNENKMKIDRFDHRTLHSEQDVTSQAIRRWREMTNHIILPNEFTEEERLKIQKKFFANIGNNHKEIIVAQLQSLYAQQSNQEITRAYSSPSEKAYELLESQTQDRINYILDQAQDRINYIFNRR